ncbi:molecular chaperone DnaJ [Tsuneonella sp. YG55]|uniref:Molecular chaperone DnaJ n=1 Tax=Tsuneonella litorea TaxID=2976475 RepID=A0A9X2VZ22_9SPHN|nr:molecular chaperone DnaJ [Tsuneonella litorea]MCT2557982.1 molecular chaperone DnaJ [Tsuneonella litorea]
MIKLLLVAGLVSLIVRIATHRWPWEYLSAKPTRAQAVLRARKLLGVPHEAGRGEILEAHRRLIARVHPDRGGTSDQVHAANDARDLLLGELPDGR